MAFQFKLRLQRRLLIGLAIFVGLASNLFANDNQSPKHNVDFERHIAPLLGRLGCNSAACHGAFGGGKGGLQLSLFGYSAKMDYQGLNARIDPSEPRSSPLLLKPSGLESHEGGVKKFPLFVSCFRSMLPLLIRDAATVANTLY